LRLDGLAVHLRARMRASSAGVTSAAKAPSVSIALTGRPLAPREPGKKDRMTGEMRAFILRIICPRAARSESAAPTAF
jgi:hypothetical protein